MNLVFQKSPVTPHERTDLNIKAFPSQEVFGDGNTYSQGIWKAMFTNMALGPKKSDSTYYVSLNEILSAYVFSPFLTHFIPAQ